MSWRTVQAMTSAPVFQPSAGSAAGADVPELSVFGSALWSSPLRSWQWEANVLERGARKENMRCTCGVASTCPTGAAPSRAPQTSFDQAVVHRTGGLLRKQHVDGLVRARRLTQQFGYNSWRNQPPSLLSNTRRHIAAKVWLAKCSAKPAQCPFELIPNICFVPVTSEAVFLDRSDSNLYCDHSPSAYIVRCGETNMKDKVPCLDVQRAARAYLPERVAGALGAILLVSTTGAVDAQLDPTSMARPVQAVEPRLAASHTRTSVDDRTEPPERLLQPREGPCEPSSVTDYLDQTSTAKSASHTHPTCPSPLRRAPRLWPCTPHPHHLQQRARPRGFLHCTERTISAAFGYSDTDDASAPAAAAAAPLPPRHHVHRSGPGLTTSPRSAPLPETACPRRTGVPSSATPSASVQTFMKSERARADAAAKGRAADGRACICTGC
ncbi:hypothetical protein DFH11DRAFT_1233100 [Phellopilus nigrolimitatus]|nr:hypothetical protein DFH11DRAFT_1233100 [Phellopilus nigrolimitatus]